MSGYSGPLKTGNALELLAIQIARWDCLLLIARQALASAVDDDLAVGDEPVAGRVEVVPAKMQGVRGLFGVRIVVASVDLTLFVDGRFGPFIQCRSVSGPGGHARNKLGGFQHDHLLSPAEHPADHFADR